MGPGAAPCAHSRRSTIATRLPHGSAMRAILNQRAAAVPRPDRLPTLLLDARNILPGARVFSIFGGGKKLPSFLDAPDSGGTWFLEFAGACAVFKRRVTSSSRKCRRNEFPSFLELSGKFQPEAQPRSRRGPPLSPLHNECKRALHAVGTHATVRPSFLNPETLARKFSR